MSDFSLTLVLQIKTSKIINDMAKVQIKSEKITAFGGIFFVLDRFDRILSSVIDSHLGLRMGASAEVIHEPEHRIPAYHRHGCKLLPILDQGDRSLISYFERGRELGVRATSVFSCAINPLKILPYFTPIRDK